MKYVISDAFTQEVVYVSTSYRPCIKWLQDYANNFNGGEYHVIEHNGVHTYDVGSRMFNLK